MWKSWKRPISNLVSDKRSSVKIAATLIRRSIPSAENWRENSSISSTLWVIISIRCRRMFPTTMRVFALLAFCSETCKHNKFTTTVGLSARVIEQRASNDSLYKNLILLSAPTRRRRADRIRSACTSNRWPWRVERRYAPNRLIELTAHLESLFAKMKEIK